MLNGWKFIKRRLIIRPLSGREYNTVAMLATKEATNRQIVSLRKYNCNATAETDIKFDFKASQSEFLYYL